jgi:hypothetical protein
VVPVSHGALYTHTPVGSAAYSVYKRPLTPLPHTLNHQNAASSGQYGPMLRYLQVAPNASYVDVTTPQTDDLVLSIPWSRASADLTREMSGACETQCDCAVHPLRRFTFVRLCLCHVMCVWKKKGRYGAASRACIPMFVLGVSPCMETALSSHLLLPCH